MISTLPEQNTNEMHIDQIWFAWHIYLHHGIYFTSHNHDETAKQRKYKRQIASLISLRSEGLYYVINFDGN